MTCIISFKVLDIEGEEHSDQTYYTINLHLIPNPTKKKKTKKQKNKKQKNKKTKNKKQKTKKTKPDELIKMMMREKLYNFEKIGKPNNLTQNQGFWIWLCWNNSALMFYSPKLQKKKKIFII